MRGINIYFFIILCITIMTSFSYADYVPKNKSNAVIRTLFTTTGTISLLCCYQTKSKDAKRFYGVNGLILLMMGLSKEDC